MAVIFAKREDVQVQQSVTLGTIKELIGEGGSINFLDSNLMNGNKRLIVILKKADGTQSQITCSKEVSEGVRSKTLTIGNLLGFEVAEYTSEEGETYNLVKMPNLGGKLISFAADEIEVVAYTGKASSKDLTPEALQALLAM